MTKAALKNDWKILVPFVHIIAKKNHYFENTKLTLLS